ncbi:MAG: DUF4062 domain-containing protein [Lentisphaeria bacterium]
MQTTYCGYNAFIASPGDVEAERQFADETINALNRGCRESLGISVDAKRWENMPPVTPRIPEEQLQDVLNREVAKAKFFVLILYKRYGQTELGHTQSNTEREINTVIERYIKNPRLTILAYFRDIPDNNDKGEQEVKVRELRERLQKMGVVYRRYKEPEEFKSFFTHDLYNVVIKMRMSPFKRDCLSKFWRLGLSEQATDPRLSIMYPPVQRKTMQNSSGNEYWLSRLVPTLYFEDYKTVHKIQKNMSILGFHDYKVFTDVDAPPNLDLMNRVWICVPRYRRAMDQLTRYQSRSCFKILPRSSTKHASIQWNINGDKIIIKSPMAKYLDEQRRTMPVSGEWNAHLGKICAVDYAVLARFADTERQGDPVNVPLQDFFFAGIRGLGTWGAAWYLDRRYKELLSLDPDSDHQILLEVRYQDNRIADVIDVSKKNKAYFATECALATIKKNIKRYRETANV